MREIIYDVIQSNYAPMLSMVLFLNIVRRNPLIEGRVRRLFYHATLFVLFMMLVTVADVVLAGMSGDKIGGIRSFVNILYFGAAPLFFIFVTNIYSDLSEYRWVKLYYVPEILNLILCTVSAFTGIIFYVSPDNVYSRGPLYLTPFAVYGFYCLFFLYIVTIQPKKQSIRSESAFLIYVYIISFVSLAFEVFSSHYFVIWTVTYISLILYFLLINLHKISYDSLSDAYTRTVYTRFLEKNDRKHPFAVAMIDINNLKYINDTYGHIAGDKAVETVSFAILRNKGKKTALYRYGGDEFVLTAPAGTSEAVKEMLEKSRAECGQVNGTDITFAFGVTEYTPDNDLHDVLKALDESMYIDKAEYKKTNNIQNYR